jgi:hypothetical protein
MADVRVATYPSDGGGCGLYRLIWPSQALRTQGADLELHAPGVAPLGLFADDLDLVTGAVVDTKLRDVIAPEADVIVLQRPTHRVIVDAIPLLQAKGVKVVIEVDDDLTALHPRNDSFRVFHPGLSPERNHRHLLRACALADHVVCTTPALARRFAAHGRYSVVPNHVPARYLATTRQPHGGTWVGWAGNMIVHPSDPQVTRSAVARVMADTGARFALVGSGTGVQQAFGLTVPPELVTDLCPWLPRPEPREVERDGRRGRVVVRPGQVDIVDYPDAIAQLDVGMVPLDNISFNHAKSALKSLEFAATGVAAVVSPTPDNVRMAMLGAGVLAARPREWRRELTRLVLEPAWRDEVAGRGRGTAAEWTIEANCGRWWDAWTAPLRARRVA